MNPDHGRGDGKAMTIQILGACLLAFLVVFLFGRYLVPWLGKNGFTQPIKKEVDDRVYSGTENVAVTDSQNNI